MRDRCIVRGLGGVDTRLSAQVSWRRTFIDDNGQAYLYYGNPDLYYVKLNADMISYSQETTKISLPSGAGFQEAPWVYKRNGIYYVAYAGTCCSENIRYMTGNSPTGPFTYKGVVMKPVQGWTTHHSIVEFKGNWYIFYHDTQLSGKTWLRNVKVTELKRNPDGSIVTITP